MSRNRCHAKNPSISDVSTASAGSRDTQGAEWRPAPSPALDHGGSRIQPGTARARRGLYLPASTLNPRRGHSSRGSWADLRPYSRRRPGQSDRNLLLRDVESQGAVQPVPPGEEARPVAVPLFLHVGGMDALPARRNDENAGQEADE